MSVPRTGCRPRRILFYNHAPEMSGAERSLVAMLRLAREAGYEPLLCTPPGDLAEAACALDVRVAHVSPLELGYTRDPLTLARYLARLPRPVRDLQRAVRCFKPALVHANSIRGGLVAIAAVRLAPKRPRLIVHVRDAIREGRMGNLVARSLTMGADTVVPISAFVGRPLAAAGGRVEVLYNAIDPALYRTDAARGQKLRLQLGIPPEAPLLAVVGQITPWKGQLEALEALAAVRAQLPSAHLLVAGAIRFVGAHRRYDNVEYHERLHARAGMADLQGHVHFSGEIADVSSVYAAADALLVPSWAEPFGRVVIEAMAAGCPVVATAAGGVPEIITDGRDGMLTPPHDPHALAAASLNLLHDGQLRQRLAVAARHTVAERFTLDGYAARLRAIWEGAGATSRWGSVSDR